MSAEKDTDSKTAFVYTNLYKLYTKSKSNPTNQVDNAREKLEDNLKTVNELHNKLTRMIKELEELVKG